MYTCNSGFHCLSVYSSWGLLNNWVIPSDPLRGDLELWNVANQMSPLTSCLHFLSYFSVKMAYPAISCISVKDRASKPY